MGIAEKTMLMLPCVVACCCCCLFDHLLGVPFHSVNGSSLAQLRGSHHVTVGPVVITAEATLRSVRDTAPAYGRTTHTSSIPVRDTPPSYGAANDTSSISIRDIAQAYGRVSHTSNMAHETWLQPPSPAWRRPPVGQAGQAAALRRRSPPRRIGRTSAACRRRTVPCTRAR